MSLSLNVVDLCSFSYEEGDYRIVSRDYTGTLTPSSLEKIANLAIERTLYLIGPGFALFLCDLNHSCHKRIESALKLLSLLTARGSTLTDICLDVVEKNNVTVPWFLSEAKRRPSIRIDAVITQGVNIITTRFDLSYGKGYRLSVFEMQSLSSTLIVNKESSTEMFEELKKRLADMKVYTLSFRDGDRHLYVAPVFCPFRDVFTNVQNAILYCSYTSKPISIAIDLVEAARLLAVV